MKKIYVLVILLLLCTTFFGQQVNSGNSFKFSNNVNDTISCKLKIVNIIKVKRAYIVDALDVKSMYVYKIVSLKGKLKKCNKIRVGEEYRFVIWPYFNIGDILPNQIITNIVEINGVIVSVPSDNWTGNIFITSDLIGLCYFSSR